MQPTGLTFKNSTVCPCCTYVYYIYLGKNSDYWLHRVSVCLFPRGTTRLPLDGLSWNFV